MKKFYFLFLFALIASISNLYAAEKTVTWNFAGRKSGTGATTSCELKVQSGSASGTWKITASKKFYAQTGSGSTSVTLGSKNDPCTDAKLELTNSPIPEGAQIKKVSITAKTNNAKGATFGLQIGGVSSETTLTFDKTKTTQEFTESKVGNVVLVINTLNQSNVSLYSLSITYEEVAETKCAKPTFSVEEGTYSEAQTITLAPGEGGEKVFYTINDGTEQQYIEPIKLEEEGTYKIAAYTAATETLAKSATVTKTYVINLPLEEPYILCKNAAWLTEGANIIFASSVAAGEQKAMSKLQKTKNRGAASVTIGSAFNAGKETVGIVSKDADVAVFTVGISNGHITFYTGDSKDEENNEVAGYLYAAGSGSGKNYLRTTKIVDPNAEWSVSVAANGAATIKAQGANTNNLMRYNPNNGNPGNPMFSCYGSGQEPVYIYLLGKTSSVSSMSVEGVKVFAAEGGVEVVADEAAEVAVYTAAGQLVRQARVAEGSTLVNVAPGFYVVRANGTATKVIVR